MTTNKTTLNKTTLKGVGDKRTKECKGCYNTSQFVCFKCGQQRTWADEEAEND